MTTSVRKDREWPHVVTLREAPGITVKIYRQRRAKPDRQGKRRFYTSYLLAYSLAGKRKLESFADLDQANDAARRAVAKISAGEIASLQLTGQERDVYVRAAGFAKVWAASLDFVAQEWAEVKKILAGTGTPLDAARYYVEHRSKGLPKITVPDAVKACLKQCRAEKSKERTHQLEHYLNGFAGDMNVLVSEITPGIVSRYLTAMVAATRTKKNARDAIGYFSRWCVLHGYLERKTDWTDGVQRYSAQPSAIEIFAPSEIRLLLERAPAKLKPYIAIGAFAGLRGAEICRLDWREIDLAGGFIEVSAVNAKTRVRRLVPIKPNLRAWLKPHAKATGRVCGFKNVVNPLMKLVRTIAKDQAEDDKLKWKRNGLRHSYISYRVAECADAARVAEESGNSVAVIRSNYLQRVRPDAASEYFGLLPQRRTKSR